MSDYILKGVTLADTTGLFVTATHRFSPTHAI